MLKTQAWKICCVHGSETRGGGGGGERGLDSRFEGEREGRSGRVED